MALKDIIESYWKMDETSAGSAPVTRVDSHGSNHLTDFNNCASATGKKDHAAAFVSASTKYLYRASNASLLCGNIDFGFAFWFYLEAPNKMLLAKDSDIGRDYTIDCVNTAPRFYINGGGNPAQNEIQWGSNLSSNAWHFLIAWHNEVANTLNLKVNNEATLSVNTGGLVPQTSASEFRIGARQYPGFQQYLDGRIDEVLFFKGLLTSDEQSYLWYGGAGRRYEDLVGGSIPNRMGLNLGLGL